MAALLNGLGGSAGFGEYLLDRNDDGSTSFIDLRTVFPSGINYFGRVYDGLWVNNNGSVTFTGPLSTYTPTTITGGSSPIIAAFWGDVDTRNTSVSLSPGGTSQGTNLVHYDLDAATGKFTVTWDDVGYYSYHNDKVNAFQIQLTRVGESDFDIAFRYETLAWTTGDVSGGSGGLGGSVAHAGYSAGDATNYYELPQSGNQAEMLNLVNTSNVNQAGLYEFQIRNGAPELKLSVDSVTMAEGSGGANTEMVFRVSLSAPSDQTVTVAYYTSPGTASAGSDFFSQAGTLTFNPGQTTREVRVTVVADSVVEDTEQFTLNLYNAVGATLSNEYATGTIVNDDGIRVDDVQVVEGTGAGSTQAIFHVRLLTAAATTVTADYSTVAGTATAGTDYTAVTGTLTFLAGETEKTVTVDIVRDTKAEADETFQLTLGNVVGTGISRASGTGTILNDDGLVVRDVRVTEGTGAGTTQAAFTVELLSALTTSVTVNYATQDGTAVAGTDYTATSGTLTFAPGETSKTVYVPITRDALVESDETFTLRLSGASGAGVSRGTGTATIVNDDGLSVSDVSVIEGNSGTVYANFTVTLSSASDQQITVNYATQPGTATAGADFTTATGTLVFNPGETSKQVSVAVLGDTLPEGPEGFTLVLSNAVNSGIVDGTGAGTILDDDGLSVSDVTVTEGNSGTVNAAFVVSLSGASTQTVTVNYATADGTATAGSDYLAQSGTLTFAPGEVSKTVNVAVLGDTVFEPNETLRLVLSGATNTNIVDASGTGFILNDDTRPPPAIYVSDAVQTEGTGAGTSAFRFTVSLSSPASGTVTVAYATADGTAVAGSDYAATTGTLTFTAGQTSQEVVVQVTRDATTEQDETFTLNLSNPSGASIGRATATATILNDDAALSIDSVQITEGNTGTSNLTFTVSLSAALPWPVSVDFATADGTAQAGSDYTARAGTLVFDAGQTTKTVVVPIVGDRTVEADETFVVNLSNAVGATIATGQGTGTILNNDVVRASVGNVVVTEPDTGSVDAVFTVTLNNPSDFAFSVDYATFAGTASAGSDYAATTGTLVFAPGETSKTVSVAVLGDRLVEADEAFTLRLTNPVGGLITTNVGTATIVNNDVAVLSVSSTSVTEGDTGTRNAAFSVTLSNPSTTAVTVDWATAAGSATAGTDFTAGSGTLTFAPGETQKTVNVAVVGDKTVEPDETFGLTLSNAVGATLPATGGVGTIVNDDTTALSVSDVTLVEGDSGTQVAQFAVTLTNLSSSTVTVNYTTVDITAAAGEDYVAKSGTLTFLPGQKSKGVSITVNGDQVVEGDETFKLVLSAPQGATIADDEGIGTIQNNDLAVVSVDSVTVQEGDSGTTNAVFTVSLSSASSSTVTLNYATADGTALASSDYTAAFGSLSFAPGETTKTVAVAVRGDMLVEGDESFSLNLSNASGASIGQGQGTGTITNDDATAVSIGNAEVVEGDSGTVNAVFTVSLSKPSANAVTVNYAIADGTATGGADFVGGTGSVVIAAGQTSQTVAVQVIGDLAVEGNETFYVNITSASVPVAQAQGVGTIVENDKIKAPTALDMVPASDSGVSNSDDLTNVLMPIIRGKAVAGDLVTLYDTDGTTVLGTGTASGTGIWTITASTLGEGVHSLTATATASGSSSVKSAPLTITIDTTPPAAPSAPDLVAASDTGSSDTDNLTIDTTPTLAGTADLGSTVRLYEGAVLLGTVTTTVEGTWEITSTALAGGPHVLTAVATDAAGNAGPASPALTVGVALVGTEGADVLTGTGVADWIMGLSGNDHLRGGAGTDIIDGGWGNDTYILASADVSSTGRVLDILLDAQGYDTVQSTASIDLARSGLTNIEDILLTGTASSFAVGHAGNNVITGNAGNNVITGNGGFDLVVGGLGNDAFVIAVGPDASRNLLTIHDFAREAGNTDTIQLDDDVFPLLGSVSTPTALNPAFFVAGTVPGDANDRLLYDSGTGALYYDADGNGAGAAVQIALVGIDSHPVLSAADFMLVP